MNGHNSDGNPQELAKRIINLMSEADRIKEDISDIYTEAKSSGHNPTALRASIKRIRETVDQKEKRLSLAEEIDLYEKALGSLADLPLGKFAIDKIQTAA